MFLLNEQNGTTNASQLMFRDFMSMEKGENKEAILYQWRWLFRIIQKPHRIKQRISVEITVQSIQNHSLPHKVRI